MRNEIAVVGKAAAELAVLDHTIVNVPVDELLIMLQVLHGQVPEGEGITVETESTYEISTIDDESTDGE